MSKSYARDDCFSQETKLEFKNLWRTHFKIEMISESLRQRLYQRPSFNIVDAFNSVDFNENGAISKDELKRILQSRGFFASEKELSQLVDKLDKNKDGKISYQEFREEFIPKSPSRF